MNMLSSQKEQAAKLPSKPGVYKFLDLKQKVIYIGKAKNLKKRVSSYFTAKSAIPDKTRVMTAKIRSIDFTVVNSEFDALLLENSLIKKYQPRYNVNLKDGKTYPFICIKNERFPRILSTRRIVRDGSEYYGPYATVGLMHVLLELIKKLYPIRSCNFALSEENIKAGKFKVCLDYHIGLCKGPCEGLQDEEEYNENIRQIRNILKGNTGEVIRHVKALMKDAAKNMNFEQAQFYKDQIEKLESFQAKSTVVNPKIKDVDVFSVYKHDNYGFVNYLKVINGAIVQTFTVEYKNKLDETEEDVILLALAELREKFNSTAKEVLIPFKAPFEPHGFKFTQPLAGDKKKLLDLSRKNAFYFGQDKLKNLQPKSKKKSGNILLEKMREDLNLKSLPVHIECIDNSHLQGTEAVSAVVVFKNGKPSNKDYRLFNLRTLTKPDDYAGMTEVVKRRYGRLQKENEALPQLLIIDGGKGQLNMALHALEELGLKDKIEVRGIAKRLEEIFAPGDPYPLHISKSAQSLRLIQHLRNEAHRFAISHHRNKRIKSGINSELEQIEGVGKSTIKALLSHYKSVMNLKSASVAEVAKIIGPYKAKKVMDYLKSVKATED